MLMQQTLNGFLVMTLCRLFILFRQYLNNMCEKGSIVTFRKCIFKERFHYCVILMQKRPPVIQQAYL